METLKFEDLPGSIQIIDHRLERIEELLRNQSSQEPDERMFTVPEVAEYLHLSVPSIYRLTSQRGIPHTRKGKKLYFLKSEINVWLSQGRRKTIDELQAEI